jgi:hypothetical protein
MMRFRMQQQAEQEPDPGQPDQELQRVRDWQRERLTRLGFRSGAAAMLVADAWVNGEQADLVHRIEDLVSRGATLDQAARIVVPAVELAAPPAA